MNSLSKYTDLFNFPQLSCFSDVEKNLMCHIVRCETVKKGNAIYEQGAKKRFVYLLDKGCVKLSNVSDDGKEMIKYVAHEMSIFGENVFAGEDIRYENAITITDSKLFKFPIDYFRKLLRENLTFSQTVMSQLILKLTILEERVQNYVLKNAKERIMLYIKKAGETRGIRIGVDERLIHHELSHTEIAFYTETSRQTVAKVLGELKKDNLIHFGSRRSNKILIRDMQSLAV